jgi:hypothetical protein
MRSSLPDKTGQGIQTLLMRGCYGKTIKCGEGIMPAKAKNTSVNKANGGFGFPVLWVVAVVLLIGLLCWGWQKHHLASACKTENLKLTAGQQSGAAGTIYQDMSLTNTGKKKCTISGYPAAFLYGADGYAVGAGAAPRSQPAPVVITLAADETAHTTLGYPQAGNFDPGICSAKSVSLKLFPPSSITALETPLEVAWCPGFSETAMQPGS